MANNGQLDFRLRINTLEVVTTATGYVTRVMNTFEIGRNEMEYRAEGNANIVLAIPQRCQVLRLPKIAKRFDTTHYTLYTSTVTTPKIT